MYCRRLIETLSIMISYLVSEGGTGENWRIDPHLKDLFESEQNVTRLDFFQVIEIRNQVVCVIFF